MTVCRDVVKRTRAALTIAKKHGGDDPDNAFKVLCHIARSDALVMQGMSAALASETFEMTGVAEAKNDVHRVEQWVEAMGATRH